MIHVAEFDGGRIRLEISNEKEFIKKVKAEARRNKKQPGTWKIRIIGTDRVSAPVQRLIDDLGGQKTAPAEPSVPSTPPTTNGSALARHEPKAKAAAEEWREQQKPVRPRPGGPLTSN